MSVMITVSLILNLAVLVPLCWGISRDAAWVEGVYGAKSPARGILLSVYTAIGLTSALLLAVPIPEAVAGLLVVQVIYKLSTPITVGSASHPVVRSNLGIAAVHSVTLVAIWRVLVG